MGSPFKMLFDKLKLPTMECPSGAIPVLRTLWVKGGLRQRRQETTSLVHKGDPRGSAQRVAQGGECSRGPGQGLSPNYAFSDFCHVALGKLFFFSHHGSSPSTMISHLQVCCVNKWRDFGVALGADVLAAVDVTSVSSHRILHRTI